MSKVEYIRALCKVIDDYETTIAENKQLLEETNPENNQWIITIKNMLPMLEDRLNEHLQDLNNVAKGKYPSPEMVDLFVTNFRNSHK